VSGPQGPVHVLAVEMAGSKEPWCLVPSARHLSAAPVVEVFTARVRQEEAIRAHQQRLGMEDGRAWTKEPILRTFQGQRAAMPSLRLRPVRLSRAWAQESWGLNPEGSCRTRQASSLARRRLCWRSRPQVAPGLGELEAREDIPPALGRCRHPAEDAA
jgi:hypothetical protein